MNKILAFLLLVGTMVDTIPLQAKTAESRRSINDEKVTINNGTATQQQPINGTITDNQGPLPGVTVTIKGTATATITDNAGKYTLAASPTDVLVFTFTGYQTLEIPISGQSTVNGRMQEDVTTLKEVTVNAGYYTVKESERTGSIAKVTAKDIEKQPVTNILAAMQGRMAGVVITQNSGVPGGGFDIRIRGTNSLRYNANNPLFIIDGVPYAADPLAAATSSNITPSETSPLNSINPDQIESIEVLKDADATAIYGSRGANGVVLVTTKKARTGKTRFSGGFSKGVGSVTRFLDLMDTRQYLEMRREAFANDGIVNYPATAYDLNGAWEQDRYTDWQKVLLGGTAEITDGHASLSGGSAQTQFLASGNFNKQTTVFPGDFNYKKGNLYLNVNHESEDKRLKAAFSVGYTIQDNDQPATDLTLDAVRLAPNAPPLYGPDGSLNWQNNTFNANPLRKLNGEFLSKTYDLVASSVLSYQVFKGLEAKMNLGYTATDHRETSTTPNTIYNPALGYGGEYSSVFITATNRKSWIAEPQLGYKAALGPGKLDVLLGSTFQSQNGGMLVQNASGFSSVSLIYSLASAANLYTLVNDEAQYRYQAVFGRINYNLLDRYILNVTGRRDGSSRFGRGRQYASFGAVGAAWLFGEEKLLKGNAVLSFGKLRASYGTTGSDQIGDYQYLDTYSATGIDYGGVVGLQPARLYNPGFGWETNKKLELALEAGFFRDRIFITGSWYSNRSSNQLVGTPLPGTTGFESVQANLGATVRNTGLELTLRTSNVRSGNFSWTTALNVTFAKNELLEFPGLAASPYAGQYVIGQPLDIQKVYHFTGVDPQTGVYTFKDVNGDGQITAEFDKTAVRDFNPSYYGGLQNHLQYKGFQLDFLFQFVKQLNYNAALLTTVPGNRANQPAALMDRWQQPGDAAPHQLFTNGANGDAVTAYYNYIESDGAISDASYVRLKNIALSWDVPQAWLRAVRCRLSLQGQNLLTFTKYDGADPEFKSSGFLPPLKVITAGLQLNY